MAHVKHAGHERTKSDCPNAHDAPDALQHPNANVFLLMKGGDSGFGNGLRTCCSRSRCA